MEKRTPRSGSNRFAASSSPLLFGDLLILQCDHYGDSYLVAIDTATGADRWKLDRRFEPAMSNDRRVSLLHGWSAAVERVRSDN